MFRRVDITENRGGSLSTSPPALMRTEKHGCSIEKGCKHKHAHTYTHIHIVVVNVLTSSGGVKAVRGFEIPVGVEVENSEPVLQSGSKAVKLCVSAGYTHTGTQRQNNEEKGKVSIHCCHQREKKQFLSCSLSKFLFISAVYFSFCHLFFFSSNSTP